MDSGCTHEEASFVSLDDLGDIFILLDENNDLEEEIKFFAFTFKKNPPPITELQNFRNFNFRKYNFQYQGPFNFADVSIFFGKNGTFTQSNSVRAV